MALSLSTRRTAIFTPEYRDRVLATDPIGYWVQDEKGGTVSYDMVTHPNGGARNGAYTGVTLAQAGIGDGRTSALFDGANDFDNIYTASLNTAWNRAEMTVQAWVRVANAGVWTDGTERRVLTMLVDGDNLVQLRRTAVNDQFNWRARGGGNDKSLGDIALPTTDWFSVHITRSEAADTFIAYRNGIQIGATLNAVGVMAGNLNVNVTNIGSNSVVPTNPWDGYIAHCAIWPRAFTPAEVLSLGVL